MVAVCDRLWWGKCVVWCRCCESIGHPWFAEMWHSVSRVLPLPVCTAVAQCFARCCTLLRTLRLQECKSVSDVGLLQVSNHCPALEVLDVSRSELAYKVTDVAMLALGERCHQLTDVNLSGCSFLTDAGIDWLVGGCHLITTLKLPGLYKLTDTGGCRGVWALVSVVCFPPCGYCVSTGRGRG